MAREEELTSEVIEKERERVLWYKHNTYAGARHLEQIMLAKKQQ